VDGTVKRRLMKRRDVGIGERGKDENREKRNRKSEGIERTNN
jgi:hypothetical protein